MRAWVPLLVLAAACSSASSESATEATTDAAATHLAVDGASTSRKASSDAAARRDAVAVAIPDSSIPVTRDSAPDVSASPDALGTTDAPLPSDASEAGPPPDTGTHLDAGPDAAITCSVNGESGECLLVSACAAKPSYTSTPGYCPGPADVECCRLTPNIADNPPTPAGYELMQQVDVTAAMTTWAVMILDNPTMYPMFSTTTKLFGSLNVLALVEWHPPDFQNSVVHRGVTLFQPIDGG